MLQPVLSRRARHGSVGRRGARIATPDPRGACYLRPSRSMDNVCGRRRHCSPVVWPEISISPDRHGSGATRIEADLSINRGEKLMRRASTCLALLGSLAVLGLPAVASAAAPTATFKAKAVPIPKPGGGLPRHGQHPRRRRGAAGRIRDHGTGYGATPQNPAADPAARRRQLLPAGRREDQLERVRHVLGSSARRTRRPTGCP